MFLLLMGIKIIIPRGYMFLIYLMIIGINNINVSNYEFDKWYATIYIYSYVLDPTYLLGHELSCLSK